MALRHDFLAIKRTFFPTWDHRNLWRIRYGSRSSEHGYCDRERKLLTIAFELSDPDVRNLVLIHEVAHAVASSAHGKVWQARMKKAASRAKQIGRTRLAQLLRDEFVNYQNGYRMGSETKRAYQLVEDWVWAKPDRTLAEVKSGLANEFGLLPREVGTMFRRVEAVFHEAKREAASYQVLRAQRLQARLARA